ncbi:TPR repeat-containing protein [Aliiroseovarius crassostreae]|uniref:Uncharacterized protein n=1 Tax=Aliiroseovarius crassostreae TaxID=154981 RepID=A0A0N8IBH0_9RHOB|nr:tetratricopeptide repeat protein [Aliiroseovarius crassostreae]KPN63083.1 hypothetical protein AKJ29_02765 [Aliiroseovarius crassostreae]SFU66669.1 TPR repeat-containing protein [Aliiroseovarius crassostreae]
MRLGTCLLFCFTLWPALGQAQSCPPPNDISVKIDGLLSEVQSARSDREAGPIVTQMWVLWKTAPDARAQALLTEGVEGIRLTDYRAAETVLGQLITYCPTYPEGFNQRAFARFLSGRYDLALEDLDAALALDPRHVAARAGRVLTLHALGRADEAQDELRAALKLNPWLPERHMLMRLPGIEL